MKKLFLFIGLSILTFGLRAEEVPSVAVTKSNGGYTAIINLYNVVTYTPAGDNGVAQLNCHGSGFSPCRVPNCVSLNIKENGNYVNITDNTRLTMFTNAINNMMEIMESNENASGNTSVVKTLSKTIAVQSSTRGSSAKQGYDTYVVKAVPVPSAKKYTENINFYIEKVNLPTIK